jgi:hypothetical protein
MRALAAAILLAALPAAAVAGSDSSIRCAHGLVSLGDATVDLLGKCGEPTLRDGHAELTSIVYTTAGRAPARAIAVGVEHWTYDFGPQRFIVMVTVTGGKVTAIENGGYGYVKAEPAAVTLRRAGCEPSALHVGDTKLDLLARCGEPTLAERRDDLVRLVADAANGVILTRTVIVPVEVWTYDFGPQTFVRFVTLEDGVVTGIDTGGHGYAQR